MNPLIVGSVLNSRPVRWTLTVAVVAVVLLGTGAAVRGAIRRIRENARKNDLDNPTNQLAAMFHNALHPWGDSAWVTWAVNVDEEELIRLAGTAQGMGTDMVKVAKAYAAMYQRRLVDDLQSVMDNSEMARLYQSAKEGRYIA